MREETNTGGRGGGKLPYTHGNVLPHVADDVSRRGDSGTRDERLAWAYLRVLRDEDGNKEGTGPSTIVVPTFPSPPPSPLRMKSSGGNRTFFQKKENLFIFFSNFNIPVECSLTFPRFLLGYVCMRDISQY